MPANTRVVAVIMERVTLTNRWATERWEAKGVVRDDAPAGAGASRLPEGAEAPCHQKLRV